MREYSRPAVYVVTSPDQVQPHHHVEKYIKSALSEAIVLYANILFGVWCIIAIRHLSNVLRDTYM